MNQRPTPNKERRNRTFEEIQREKELENQKQEVKKKKKGSPPKLPVLFPRLRLKRSVQYALVAVFFLILLGVVNRYRSGQICKELNITFISDNKDAFLSKSEIEKMIEEGYESKVVGVNMGSINLKKMEVILKGSPYISDAQVSKSFGGKLNISVKLREPVARIMNSDGTSIYLDKDGIKFPTANRHSSNVPLIRGALYENLAPRDSFHCELVKNAMPVIKYIDSDKFWNSQISEIYITQSNELIFYPQIGNIFIEFGEPKRIKEKFEDMKRFYDQVIKEVGWNKYKGFSVKFKGQVVAKKI